MKRFKNILLVVDPELKDDTVLEWAVALAENNQARLTVISVIEGIPPILALIAMVWSPTSSKAP